MAGDDFHQNACDKEHERIDEEIKWLRNHRESDLEKRDELRASDSKKYDQFFKDIYEKIEANEEKRNKRDWKITGLLIGTLVALAMNLGYMLIEKKGENKDKHQIEQHDRRGKHVSEKGER